MNKLDVNHTIGHWTVLRKNGDRTWLCRCRCGTERNVPETWLLSGLSKSCGCRKSRAQDLHEKRFGRLTVIEPIGEKHPDGSIRWQCVCDCGNETVVSSNHLLQGHTMSCGCWNRETFKSGKTHVQGTCLEILFSPTIRKNNTSGHTGVHKKGSKWIAYITVGKTFYWLGSYDNYEEAVDARKKAEEEWKKVLLEEPEAELLTESDA